MTAANASSSTSSRTSRTWCTSETAAPADLAPPGPLARLGGVLRLCHPFPSILDGLVASGLALIAGADGEVAIRVGLSMTALQAAIGAANDIVDAPADAIGKPAKPIPAGLVGPAVATLVCGSSLAIGLLLALGLGLPSLAVAAAVVGVGFAYDLALKGSAWSWLPFALGIPLLPVYAWLPATGSLPAVFVVLLPTAVVAGTALAIANALVDVERDRLAGVTSVAAHLGPAAAGRLVLGLHAGVVAVALASAIVMGGGGPGLIAAGIGSVGIAVGVALGRSADPARRERGWEIQAIGVGVLAIGWLAVLGGDDVL